MKANELMIGDWVCYCKANNWLTKVEAVNNPGQTYISDVYGIKCYRVKDDPLYEKAPIDFFNVDILHPILLTADILEANGWERNPLLKYNDELRILDDYYELNIHEFNDGTWNVQYDCIETGGIPMCSMNICYVHELQHFLRAVGIDTEIIVKEATP